MDTTSHHQQRKYRCVLYEVARKVCRVLGLPPTLLMRRCLDGPSKGWDARQLFFCHHLSPQISKLHYMSFSPRYIISTSVDLSILLSGLPRLQDLYIGLVLSCVLIGSNPWHLVARPPTSPECRNTGGRCIYNREVDVS